MSKKIQLSDHFTYGRLLRFVMPSILMILCTSVYTIVDGFFVSNYVGKTAFAALNLVWPVLMVVSTIGFLIGTGG
ncbi:MAG: MATE family efflux transporter, partial [Ruminococcus sp.]|nr:MATE family efflux transporter [Ruminococcus sp.]